MRRRYNVLISTHEPNYGKKPPSRKAAALVISNCNRFYVTIRNISSYERGKAIAEAHGKRYFRIVLDFAPRFKINRPVTRKKKMEAIGKRYHEFYSNFVRVHGSFYNDKMEFLANLDGL